MAVATKPVSAYQMAREAYNAANGDIHEATDVLIKETFGKLPPDDVQAAIIRKGAYELVCEVMRNRRARILRSAAPEPTVVAKSPNGLKKGQSGESLWDRREMEVSFGWMYMNYPLKNNLVLGDATYDDVEEQEHILIEQGNAMIRDGKWLGRVKKKLTSKTKPVREQLTEEQLRALYETA